VFSSDIFLYIGEQVLKEATFQMGGKRLPELV
jgi:hypothetical protein